MEIKQSESIKGEKSKDVHKGVKTKAFFSCFPFFFPSHSMDECFYVSADCRICAPTRSKKEFFLYCT